MIQIMPMVVEVASTKGHAQMILISVRDSADDFSVKLNPCLCSYSSCSDGKYGPERTFAPKQSYIVTF